MLPSARLERASAARVGLALVLLASAAAYAPSLAFDLAWDDHGIVSYVAEVVRERGVAGLATAEFRIHGQGAEHMGYFRPVVLLSFHLDALLARGSPASYHATNVLLHTANSGLVFLLLLAVAGSVAGAAFGGLLFALHPAHVESVAFVSGRTDLWATLFVLLAALAWLRGRAVGERGSIARAAASGVCFLLALLSKEAAVLAPVVLLAADALERPSFRLGWWARNGRWVSAWGAALAVAAAMRVLAARVGFGVAPSESTLGALNEPLLSLRIWMTYLRLLVIPWPLSANYAPADMGRDLLNAAGAALNVGLFLAAVRAGRSAWLGPVWVAAFLLPVSGLVPLAGAVAAERFLYLPSVGLCIVAAFLARRAEGRPRLRRAAAVAGILVLAAALTATVARSRIWRDNLALFEDAVRTSPASAEIRYNLGREYLARRRWAEAADANLKALELQPSLALAANNLGVAYSGLGRRAEAIEAFRRSVLLDRGCAGCYANLGLEYTALGRWGEAAAAYAEAARIAPGDPAFRRELDRALAKQASGRGGVR